MKNVFSTLMEKKIIDGFRILKGNSGTVTKVPILQFDGGSVPNPGPSSGGAVLYDSDRKTVLFEIGDYVEYSTNNQAEYFGLWLGLQKCVELGYKEILIEGDSQLVLKQVAGEWKINEPTLKQLQKTVVELIEGKFDFVAVKHVLRGYNKHADAITNEVIERKEGFFRC
jgi:ribonuclease HI